MKVQLVTPYRVSLLQRYGVTVRGNVTSVYPPLVLHIQAVTAGGCLRLSHSSIDSELAVEPKRIKTSLQFMYVNGSLKMASLVTISKT